MALISIGYAIAKFGKHVDKEGEAGIRGKNPEKALNPATSAAGVAPHAGAWIETNEDAVQLGFDESPPMRGRGLKRHSCGPCKGN